MSESPTPKTARERAFEIFKAAGGRIPSSEIFAHLKAEGYTCSEGNVGVWKTRDKWVVKVPKGSRGSGPVHLERMLIAPKVEKLVELDRVEEFGRAGEDILKTAGLMAQKLRARVDAMKPEEILVKEIGPLIESIGVLFSHCAAIDAEVQRRKGDLAKELANPNAPGVIEHEPQLTPLQIAAKEYAEGLVTKRRGS